MDPLITTTQILTSLSFILLLGILISFISYHIKIDKTLLLIIAGIALWYIRIEGNSLVDLPSALIFGIAILSLITIVFSGSSLIKLRELDKITSYALKLEGSFMLFNILILIPIGLFIFGFNLEGFVMSLILAIISGGTDAGSVFSMTGVKKSNILNILKVESILNTPIVVVIPMIIARILKEGKGDFAKAILINSPEIFKVFVTGIGTGIVLGIIMVKLLNAFKENIDKEILLFSGAFLTYVSSEFVGGDGIIAVATLGVVFGTLYKGISVASFSIITAQVFEILIFILLGGIVASVINGVLLLKALLVFLGIFIARVLAVQISLKEIFSNREKLVALFFMPKGIATGVTAIALMLMLGNSFKELVGIILLTLLYSLILSSIAILINEKSSIFLQEEEVNESESKAIIQRQN